VGGFLRVRDQWRCAPLLLLVAFVLNALLLAAEADAATRTKLDRWSELRFTLGRSSLTLTIRDRENLIQSPTIQGELFGKRLWVGCGTSFRSPARKTVAHAVVRWPRGMKSITVPLDRDISRSAKWCLVEGTGRADYGDIAFVSFHEAEPGRRLATGHLGDGTPWRLVAWRGNKLQPCVQLRLPGGGGTSCFEDEAETAAGVQGYAFIVSCSNQTFVVGAVSRAAARVDVRRDDGAVVPATLHARPRGSRVRAHYFTALVDGLAGIESVTAYDRGGSRIARDRGINGMGFGDCGGPMPSGRR
jgi:hypothetical protein